MTLKEFHVEIRRFYKEKDAHGEDRIESKIILKSVFLYVCLCDWLVLGTEHRAFTLSYFLGHFL